MVANDYFNNVELNPGDAEAEQRNKEKVVELGYQNVVNGAQGSEKQKE
jgi:hypothetical protein